jgi:hypothetical protein
MPELPKEQKTEHPHGENQPIDDMLDGSGIHQLPDQIGQVVSSIHTALYEDYQKFDMRAMDQQRQHRRASRIAIGFGTTAILLSLIGIVLEAKGNVLRIDFTKECADLFFYVEVAFFLIATAVIFKGLIFTRWHVNWLEERFCAEQYRTLKFRALLQSSLFCGTEKPWDERYSLWRGWFDSEVLATKNRINRDIGQWCMSDTVSPPPPGTCGFSFDERYLRDLIEYYQSKRLRIQIAYFEKQSSELEIRDEQFRKILNAGFYLGIVFVFLRIIDTVLMYFSGDLPLVIPVLNISILKFSDFFQILNILILLIMLILPILAFAVRTLRSSTEVGRSASLYHAKRDALVDFKFRLVNEIERNPRNWEKIVKILWECENHLEEVNREWFRIMKEAEWFV